MEEKYKMYDADDATSERLEHIVSELEDIAANVSGINDGTNNQMIFESLETIGSILDKRLTEICERIKSLEDAYVQKNGGWDEDSLNVTLYTDKPIRVINEKEEK